MPRKKKIPKQQQPRKQKAVKVRQGTRKGHLLRQTLKGGSQKGPPAQMLPPVKPPAVQQREKGRPANNTTCDIYFDPNAPPAAPDVAAVPCCLLPQFQMGSEHEEGDPTFRYSHLLYLASGTDIRDKYPNAPGNLVCVPDKTGTPFKVVFVELVNRGTPAAYIRVYLNRQAPTWPTQQL